MKEAILRKYHRRAGAVVVIFAVFQAGSGLLLSIERITGWTGFRTSIGFIHTGDGGVGNLYRILLGCGLLFMVATGGWIFRKILARTRLSDKKAQ